MRPLIFLFFTFLSLFLFGQGKIGDTGHWLIRNYSPEEFGSNPKCVDILQDKRGVIYVANARGVLEYDGVSWRLIHIGIGNNAQALAMDSTGTIYVGGLNTLGYLAPDATGQMRFVSMTDQLPPYTAFQNFGYFRDAVLLGNSVFMRGEKLMVRIRDRQVIGTWKVNGWKGTFTIGDRLFADQLNPGLTVFENGQLKPVPGGQRFENSHVYVMLPMGDKILVGTIYDGLYLYDPHATSPPYFQRFQTEVDEYLRIHQCYSGVRLPDRHFALGTFTGGLVIIDSLGNWVKTLDQSTGLDSRLVENMTIDSQGGLWVSSENGITRIEIHTPLAHWWKETGLGNKVNGIARYQGNLYLATYNDLLYINPDEQDARFTSLGDIGKTINPTHLLTIPFPDGSYRLIAGGSSGLAEIQASPDGSHRVKPIFTTDNFEYVYYTPQYPDHIYSIDRVSGLIRALRFYLRPDGGTTWRNDGQLELKRPTYLETAPDGNFWIGTYSDGFARVQLAGNGSLENVNVSYYGTEKGLPSEKFTVVLPIRDSFYFQTEKGWARYDPKKDSFITNTTQSGWLHQLGADYLFHDNNSNLQIVKITTNSQELIGMAFYDKKADTFLIDTTFRKRLPLAISTVYTDDQGTTWIGTNRGLYRYRHQSAIHNEYPLSVLIRQVITGDDSLLFAGTNYLPAAEGFLIADDSRHISLVPELPYSDNSLSINFAAQGFDDEHLNQYQYFLEGFDKSWSGWVRDTKKEYTNLPEGSYVFKVKARDVYGNISPVASFSFVINSPWWLSVWAYALYLLAAFMIFLLGWRYRSRIHRRQLARKQAELEQQRQLNERLRQVDHLKDQFLANTSHEFRTPLQGIIGLSETLFEKEKDPAIREDLSMIISSSKRLSHLVNDILDFSKLKNYEIELERKPVDLHALTDIILKVHLPMLKGKKLKFINEVPSYLPAADGDENRLQQVMYNLIGNAVKFTEKGHIRVRAFQEKNFLQVSVQDTGIGIPPNKRAAIFREFEQGDGSLQREFAGTGLGLSISKRLIELHGGNMWFESEEGKGTTFYFTLPVSMQKIVPSEQVESVFRPANLLPLPLTPEPEVKSAAANGADDYVNVLIVDDEPINQRVLRSYLGNHYFRITAAMNGEEALRVLDSDKHFDLVLLDVMMPRMSGYEVCEKIRTKFLPSELPVIMVTAKNQVRDLVHGLSTGANDYLGKPFSREEFLARVKTQLNLHRINLATGKFVPYEFLRSLGRETITDVHLGDNTQKVVTVLFCDIRGYTSLAEDMTPQENFLFVNSISGRLGPVIRKNHGFINQYLGDAVMAIFPDKAGDALQASIEMQKVLQDFNRERQAEGRPGIRIGMGFHTGSLIMGVIGDDKRMDAATISDTVNTASRLESITKYYGVNILLSQDSMNQIEHPEHYLVRYLGKVQLMGKKAPLNLYECFEGDSSESVELKKQTLPLFQQALAHYLNQEFDNAIQSFKSVLEIHPQDAASAFFLQQARDLSREGVPKNWTGVIEMHRK